MNHITLITLGVSDLTASREFYKKLGFVTANNEEHPAIVMFQTGDTIFSLYPINGLMEDADQTKKLQKTTGFSGVALAHNVNSKEEVDAVYHMVKQNCAAITKEPQETFWGGYHFYFTDPDGYYWEVAYVYPQE